MKKNKQTEEKKESVLKNASEPTQEDEVVHEEDSTNQNDEILKWKDLALRSQAEMENLRKRTQIDIEKAHKYALFSFAKELLNVEDCLNGAIGHAEKEIQKLKESGETACLPFLESLLKGIQMTEKQLSTVFEHTNIKKVDSLGVVFDPNLHKVIQ